jgi:hypothetical protein
MVMRNAVLTGDIVNSMQLAAAAEKGLQKQLRSIAGDHPIEFYRGDSFQVYLKEADTALQMALLFRCAAKKIAGADGKGFDIRISIGLGPAKKPVRSLALAKGEAFTLSGRAFDRLKEQKRTLLISSTDAMADLGLDILAKYTDHLFDTMTSRQAEIVFEMISGYTQLETAQRVDKAQATVHQHLKAANWTAIQFLLNKFTDFIKVLPA